MLVFIVHILYLGGVIMLIAHFLSGVQVKSYGTAVLVAIIYAVINFTLGTLLKLLSLPFIILTLGIFIFLINAFLLWLTDKLLTNFKIDTFGTTFIAAVLITLAEVLFVYLI